MGASRMAMEALLGAELVSGDQEVSTAEALAGKKYVGIYFSAHWCPPCRGFTPKLAEWYKAGLKDKMEIIFISSDRDEASFKEYFAEMPWLCLPFENRDAKALLSKACNCEGIPHLAVFNADGSLVTEDGRAAVSKDNKAET